VRKKSTGVNGQINGSGQAIRQKLDWTQDESGLPKRPRPFARRPMRSG